MTTWKHRSPPLTRLIAILAIVVTLPFSGMAAAVQAQLCDTQPVASAVTSKITSCCGERHLPCGTQGQSCTGTASGCAQSGGQVQAIDRACIAFAAMDSSLQSVFSPTVTLISAAGPDGQWRPPRSL